MTTVNNVFFNKVLKKKAKKKKDKMDINVDRKNQCGQMPKRESRRQKQQKEIHLPLRNNWGMLAEGKKSKKCLDWNTRLDSAAISAAASPAAQ